jgi:hypothetical protein
MKKQTFYVMEYQELEELVQKAYHVGYSYLYDTSPDNDTIHEHWAEKPKYIYSSLYLENWKEFLAGPPKERNMWNVELILQHLCVDGFIPAGKYLIRVSW